MSNRVSKTFIGVAAVTGLLAAVPAQADHVSVGVGLSDGYGNYLSVGVGRPGYCRPAPVVVAPAPVIMAPAPVVVAPAPVVMAPAPVVAAPVVATPVVATTGGYWADVESQVWVEGVWVDFVDEWGHHGRRQGPGHWENHHGREWRTGPGPQGGYHDHGPQGGYHDHGPQGGFGGDHHR